MKFEHFFAFAMLAGLIAALFIYADSPEVSNLIIGALVAGFGSITAFFFTKHNPNSSGK